MKTTNKTQYQRGLMAVLSATITLTLLLSACAPAGSPAATQAAGNVAASQPVTVKMAMLPIIDALPFYVASQQGYFKANNVDISYIPTASAAERDQLIAAGQADGMINDLVSVALYNKQAVQVQTVRFARTADAKTVMYRVLAAKNSGIKTAADLVGVPVGMSQGTVIDYVTSRLLEQEGLKQNQIKSVAVPKLPDRMALLNSGEVKAATLPEPFGTMAQQAGAIALVDDSKYPQYGYSVISFRKTVIDQHPEAIRGILSALEKATTDINQNPDQWRALLGQYKLVPAAIQETYPIGKFPTAAVPSEAQWKDVIDWMKTRQMLSQDLAYGDSITASYLPK